MRGDGFDEIKPKAVLSERYRNIRQQSERRPLLELLFVAIVSFC
jgi:hypothetical protein